MPAGASIYILQCAETRLSEHASGAFPHCYTFRRRPVALLYAESYDRLDEAVAAERRLRGWSRAKKEAYMRGDLALLSKLARRRGGG